MKKLKEIFSSKTKLFLLCLVTLLIVFQFIPFYIDWYYDWQSTKKGYYTNAWSLSDGCSYLTVYFGIQALVLLIIYIIKKNVVLDLISIITSILTGGISLAASILLMTYASDGNTLGVAIPMAFFSIITLLLAILKLIEIINSFKKKRIVEKASSKYIKIKSKKINTYIFPEKNTLQYRDEIIDINEITDIEILNRSKVVAKSGMAEAIIAGTLFGGLGAMAGAYAGKKDKNIEDFKVLLRTSNVYCSAIFIPASYENCIKITETIFLLRKNGENSK